MRNHTPFKILFYSLPASFSTYFTSKEIIKIKVGITQHQWTYNILAIFIEQDLNIDTINITYNINCYTFIIR